MKKLLLSSLVFAGTFAFSEAASGFENLADLFQFPEGESTDLSLIAEQLKDPVKRETLLSMLPESLRSMANVFFQSNGNDVSKALDALKEDPTKYIDLLSTFTGPTGIEMALTSFGGEADLLKKNNPADFYLLEEDTENFMKRLNDTTGFSFENIVDADGKLNLASALSKLSVVNFSDPELQKMVKNFMMKVQQNRLFSLIQDKVDEGKFLQSFMNDPYFRSMIFMLTGISDLSSLDNAEIVQKLAKGIQAYISSSTDVTSRLDLFSTLKNVAKTLAGEKYDPEDAEPSDGELKAMADIYERTKEMEESKSAE